MKKALLSVEGFPNKDVWLQARKSSGLGGSEVSHLLAASMPEIMRNPLGAKTLWLMKNPAAREKLSPKELQELEELTTPSGVNLAVREALEPAVAEMLNEELEEGLVVHRPSYRTILTRSTRRSLHYSPDAFVQEGEENLDFLADSTRGVAEFKTIHPYASFKWTADDPDYHALIQAHVGMIVSGKDEAWVAGMVGYGDSKADRLVYHLEKSPDLEEVILEVAEKFQGYVERDEEPPADGLVATTTAIRLIHGRKAKKGGATITLGAQWAKKQVELEAAKKREAEAEREKTRLRQEIETEMRKHKASQAMIPLAPAAGLATPVKYTLSDSISKAQLCRHCQEVLVPGGKPKTYFQGRKQS